MLFLTTCPRACLSGSVIPRHFCSISVQNLYPCRTVSISYNRKTFLTTGARGAISKFIGENRIQREFRRKVSPPNKVRWGLRFYIWPFELEIGTSLTPAPLWNVYANFGFAKPFCFRVRSPYARDGQADRRTGRTGNVARRVTRLLVCASVEDLATAATTASAWLTIYIYIDRTDTCRKANPPYIHAAAAAGDLTQQLWC